MSPDGTAWVSLDLRTRYECYGGPADGMVMSFAADHPPGAEFVYVRLPVSHGGGDLYHTAPAGLSAKYRLNQPSAGRAKWCGDVRTYASPPNQTEGSP